MSIKTIEMLEEGCYKFIYLFKEIKDVLENQLGDVYNLLSILMDTLKDYEEPFESVKTMMDVSL